MSSDEGAGDEWPQLRAKVLGAEILVMATPTWLGQPSSVAKRVLERMDAMISETDEGHDWSASTGQVAAGSLVAVARALQATPVPPPEGQ